MSKRLDLTGKKFGHWTVLRFDCVQNKKGRWICQCDCGTIKSVFGSSLTRKASSSCGCDKIEDLTGKIFGEWTVLRFDSRTKKNNDIKWFCKCSCGTEKPVYANVLRQGKSKSCGCKNKIEMVGRRFGRLVVLERVPSHRIAKWACLCDCGNTVFADGADLRRKKVVSCGCYNKEKNSAKNTINLTGKKFGRLTVLERAGSNKHGTALWKCACDCGNVKILSGLSLRSGKVQSCRCLQIDLLRERAKTEEFKEKFRGKNNPSYGIVRHSRGCWYSIPSGSTIWIRSTYEKRVLDYLISHDVSFEYEPKTFDLGNYTYTPDLYLNDYDTFWEVKGYLRDKDRVKLEMFLEKYNDTNLRMIQIDDILQLEENENLTDISITGTSLKNYLEDIK